MSGPFFPKLLTFIPSSFFYLLVSVMSNPLCAPFTQMPPPDNPLPPVHTDAEGRQWLNHNGQWVQINVSILISLTSSELQLIRCQPPSMYPSAVPHQMEVDSPRSAPSMQQASKVVFGGSIDLQLYSQLPSRSIQSNLPQQVCVLSDLLY
jgi:hypothetical protein